jgi:hypothetical protein
MAYNPGGGSGSVTSVSVTTANGVSGSVANATTTPAITLSLGAITPSTVNTVTISGSSTPTLAVTGASSISGANTGDQTITLTGDVTGSGTGSFSATIASGAVTLAKMANIADQRVIGNVSGGAAAPSALTAAQISTFLSLGTLATQSGTFSGTSSGTNTGDQTITLTGDVTGTGTGSFAATIKSSVALAGAPTAATAAVGTNTTQIATTAFVIAQDDDGHANLTTRDVNIGANRSTVISATYEVGSGFVTDIGSDGTLEVL